jgi:hypothetical protein
MSDRVVWAMPHMSQEFHRGPVLKQPAFDRAILAYDFEAESGEYEWEEIHFHGVAAVRFTFAGVCQPEQIDAYDRLVDVGSSSWRLELYRPPMDLRHFRIFFDDVGCYEFLAETFVPPQSSTATT